MRRMAAAFPVAALIALTSGTLASAQEKPPAAPTPPPAETAEAEETEKKPRIPFRPIESNVIINLPSVEVPSQGTLTMLVTHRFEQPIQDGDINNFFTLDEGNTWGFGLWYAPLKNLNIGFSRSSYLDDYEASAQYELPRAGGFSSSLRVGGDWRTEETTFGRDTSPKSSFFAQAVLAYSFGKYVRLTAVPTYLQRTNTFRRDVQVAPPGDVSCRPSNPFIPQLPFNCSGLYENIFNVPVALSIAITHSITIHGEVTPARAMVNSAGVGWAVTVEKSLLRHRFAFFAGNQRYTTVDQYLGAVPYNRNPSNIYIGFNLFRAWKLN